MLFYLMLLQWQLPLTCILHFNQKKLWRLFMKCKMLCVLTFGMLFSFNAFSEENVPTDTTISTPEIEEVENGANQPSLTPKTEQKKTAEAEDTPTQDNVPVEKSL